MNKRNICISTLLVIISIQANAFDLFGKKKQQEPSYKVGDVIEVNHELVYKNYEDQSTSFSN